MDSGGKKVMPPITTLQQESYNKNGYLVIPRLVSHNHLEMYKTRFLEIAERKIKDSAVFVIGNGSLSGSVHTGQSAIYKLQDFMYDDILFGYCCLDAIVDVVQSIIGSNIMAVHTMLINKPPDRGSGSSVHPFHQDLHYFPFRPADKIIASWTAMERVDTQNGCLVVLPGSHKQPLLPHSYPRSSLINEKRKKLTHGIDDEYLATLADFKRVDLEMEPGDTVFFHPLLIHGSGPNRTSGFRKAISCHYASSNCHYIDVKGTVQENLADEIAEIVTQKHGMSGVDFRDIWRSKVRLVRGLQSNL